MSQFFFGTSVGKMFKHKKKKIYRNDFTVEYLLWAELNLISYCFLFLQMLEYSEKNSILCKLENRAAEVPFGRFASHFSEYWICWKWVLGDENYNNDYI